MSLTLFRDTTRIEPPDDIYERRREGTIDVDSEDVVTMFHKVPAPTFAACEQDIWLPNFDEDKDEVIEEEHVPTWQEVLLKKFKVQAVHILDHNIALILVFVGTFWALFAEDMAFAVPLDKDVDKPFAWTNLCFLIFFTVEQTCRSIAQYEEYCFTFFWWMELVANASMILSLGPLIIDENSCDEAGTSMSNLDGLAAGSRLARVMRLLRVLRVLRVFNSCRKRTKEGREAAKKPQSAIGKALNEKLVRSLIMIVIALQLIFPLLNFDEQDYSRKLAFDVLVLGDNVSLTYGLGVGTAMWETYRVDGEYAFDPVEGRYERIYPTLIKTVVGGHSAVFTAQARPSFSSQYAECLAKGVSDSFAACPPNIAKLRCTEIEFIQPSPGVAEAYWEVQELSMAQAQYNITLVLLLMSIILVMYTALSGDVASMVVTPIEGMVMLVKKLSEDPNYQLETQSKSKYETEAVRIALAKIVGLMQLGFGGAGHEIISSNLANSDNAGLDLMLRGKKKDCAYGFCDIRQFTDTVECLQDQVMLFTNSVGEIVHQSCHDNRGEPNKNIGDAFLIVWRPRSMTDNTKVVDGALTAFRRCVREVASSQTLQLVTNVEAIHKKFGRGKYRTKLGFGLHFGWSVEGPVGSPTKIDCSYLSPEVKISDRLEAATKIYSSNVLMSGQFYDLLSDHIKVGIRLIDHVTLKGGVKPFRIYADDRSNLWLKINPRLVEIYGAEAAYEQFSKTFHEGVDAFIKGDWPTAFQKLEGARDFCPKDSPTLLILKEMKKHSIDPVTPTAPVDWKGYHASEV